MYECSLYVLWSNTVPLPSKCLVLTMPSLFPEQFAQILGSIYSNYVILRKLHSFGYFKADKHDFYGRDTLLLGGLVLIYKASIYK